MDPEPKLLRAFLAIFDAPTISAAARTAGVSQPTMSGHLRRLRAHFGDALFEPNRGTLRHTPVADALHGEIASVVDGLDRLGDGHFRWSPAGSDRLFRLRASAYVQELIAARLDARLQAAGPALRLEIGAPGSMDDAGLDLAIGPRETFSPASRMRVIFRERLVCLLAAELIPDGALSLDLFCALPHLLVAPAPSPPHDAVDEALGALDRSRRVARIVSAEADLATMLAGADRLAMLPERMAWRHAPGLAMAVAPLPLPPISFAMVWPPARDRDPSHLWLRGQVSEIAREIDRPAA